jgi:hypothetical protein
MSETDMLHDLLTSDPNEPATKGHLLLFRAEVKSEFKTVRTEIGALSQRMDERFRGVDENFKRIDSSIQLLALEVGKLAQSRK